MNAPSSGQGGRLLVSAVAIVLLLLAAAPNPVSVAHGDDDSGGAMLARTGADYWADIQPLDPQTLADDGDQLSSEPGKEQISPGTMIFSGDSKIVAGMSLENEILVEDAATKTVRARIDPHGSVWLHALSADGSRIVVDIDADFSDTNLKPPAWKVFDVATGKVIASIQGDSTRGDWGNVAVDPVFWRMYQLRESSPGSDVSMQTQPAELVVFDLNTGDVAGKTELPDVQIGSWTDESQGDEATGEPLFVAYTPGPAISPDGRQIAIAHATDDGITLVDAMAVKVERTLTMKPKTNLLDQLFALLPLAPHTASAKMAEMTNLRATYTADGKQLLVYGDDSHIENGDMVMNGRGISLVDLDNGTIEAHALDGVAVNQIITLPGDDGMYIAGTEWSNDTSAMGPPFMIAHLDLDSLDVLATRNLPAYAVLVTLPSPQT